MAACTHANELINSTVKLFVTLYYKQEKSQVNYAPDFYLHQTNDWLVFPHELQGILKAELIKHKPGLKKIKQVLLECMAR